MEIIKYKKLLVCKNIHIKAALSHRAAFSACKLKPGQIYFFALNLEISSSVNPVYFLML